MSVRRDGGQGIGLELTSRLATPEAICIPNGAKSNHGSLKVP